MNIASKSTLILKSDAPNPDYDGRCRYGLRAKKTLAAGTIINIVTRQPLNEELRKIGYTYNEYSIFSDQVSKEFVDSLDTEEHSLTPIEEFDENYSRYNMRGMVHHFLTTGVITIDQIKEYMERDED